VGPNFTFSRLCSPVTGLKHLVSAVVLTAMCGCQSNDKATTSGTPAASTQSSHSVAATAPSPLPKTADSFAVVQGKGIGPIYIGMPLADMKALGRTWSARDMEGAADGTYHSGPFRAVVIGGKVADISLQLGPGARASVNSIPLAPNPELADVARLLSGCGERVKAEGGDFVVCAEDTLVKSGCTNEGVEVQVLAPGRFQR
jgi:hypothetical protein